MNTNDSSQYRGFIKSKKIYNDNQHKSDTGLVKTFHYNQKSKTSLINKQHNDSKTPKKDRNANQDDQTANQHKFDQVRISLKSNIYRQNSAVSTKDRISQVHDIFSVKGPRSDAQMQLGQIQDKFNVYLDLLRRSQIQESYDEIDRELYKLVNFFMNQIYFFIKQAYSQVFSTLHHYELLMQNCIIDVSKVIQSMQIEKSKFNELVKMYQEEKEKNQWCSSIINKIQKQGFNFESFALQTTYQTYLQVCEDIPEDRDIKLQQTISQPISSRLSQQSSRQRKYSHCSEVKPHQQEKIITINDQEFVQT